MQVVKKAFEFNWDKGNQEKPAKHNLSINEVEEAFFDDKKVVFGDWKHSTTEKRLTLLGKTEKGKLINVTYTKRGQKIRVITARTINKKEVYLYEKTA